MKAMSKEFGWQHLRQFSSILPLLLEFP